MEAEADSLEWHLNSNLGYTWTWILINSNPFPPTLSSHLLSCADWLCTLFKSDKNFYVLHISQCDWFIIDEHWSLDRFRYSSSPLQSNILGPNVFLCSSPAANFFIFLRKYLSYAQSPNQIISKLREHTSWIYFRHQVWFHFWMIGTLARAWLGLNHEWKLLAHRHEQRNLPIDQARGERPAHLVALCHLGQFYSNDHPSIER